MTIGHVPSTKHLDQLGRAIDDVTYDSRTSFVGNRIMAERLASVLFAEDFVLVAASDVSAAIVGLSETAYTPLADRLRRLLDSEGLLA